MPTVELPLGCVAGTRCVNYVLGKGDWRVTLAALDAMPYRQRKKDWPNVTEAIMDALVEYVEALNLQEQIQEAKAEVR